MQRARAFRARPRSGSAGPTCWGRTASRPASPAAYIPCATAGPRPPLIPTTSAPLLRPQFRKERTMPDTAPTFALPDTDGRTHSLDGDTSVATVVVFTCNHCPYALAWHDRIADVARDYADRGVRVLAINPNDAERYP